MGAWEGEAFTVMARGVNHFAVPLINSNIITSIIKTIPRDRINHAFFPSRNLELQVLRTMGVQRGYFRQVLCVIPKPCSSTWPVTYTSPLDLLTGGCYAGIEWLVTQS